jgi:hypothetical protein
MTKPQLSAMIKTLLDRAQEELIQADSYAGTSSWITCMTASKVYGGLAAALIEARTATKDNPDA